MIGIVTSETLEGHAGDKACRDSGPLKGRAELLAEAKGQALSKFRLIMAPYNVSMEIVLIEEDDSDLPDEAEDRIERGIEWAKAGRMDRTGPANSGARPRIFTPGGMPSPHNTQ